MFKKNAKSRCRIGRRNTRAEVGAALHQRRFYLALKVGAHGLNEYLRVQVIYDSRNYLYRLMKIYGDQ